MTKIDSFKNSWKYIRGMTKAFVEALPDQYWEYQVSPKHAALCKQFRHMVWVTDLYMAALRNEKMDMADKKKSYAGSTGRADILKALEERDSHFADLLDSPKLTDASYRVDFFGTPMTFDEFADVIIQHESLHQGMWSVYAANGGFPVPKGWKSDWGL